MQKTVSVLFLSECEGAIRSFHGKPMLGEGVITASGLAGIMEISLDQAVDLMCGSPVEWIDDNLAEKSFADILATVVSRCVPSSDSSADIVHGLAPFLYLYEDNILYHIDDLLIEPINISIHQTDDKSLELFVIIPGDAGELFRNMPSEYSDAGVRYYLRSHEGDRHHKPHVHLDYRHMSSAVVDITSGDIIEQSGGRFPRKQLKAAVERIRDNESLLLDAWNRQTDGLTVDLNFMFGKTLLER